MSAGNRMQVRFWGVRGSIPTPEANKLAYGGNTSCVEVRLGSGELLIFDAGSGIRQLGEALTGEDSPAHRHIHLLLTHFHWDHVEGLPFFSPLYRPDQRIELYGDGRELGLETILQSRMASPHFPVQLDRASAKKEFREVAGDGPFRIGEARVYPFSLHHPQGATGYRIECGGRAVVYATDYEHGDYALDLTLREAAEGADILICDSQYTPAEYEAVRGWGHTTWAEAARLAADARARHLILFHHDPGRTDDQLDAVVREARQSFESLDAAREGMVLSA